MKLNINIRCIEIGTSKERLEKIKELNINIRCIEMMLRVKLDN